MSKKIETLRVKHGFSTKLPLSDDILTSRLKSLGIESLDFAEFYRNTNGMIYEWFEVFPLYDKQNLKNTWNSLERANDSEHSSYLKGYPSEIRSRFLVFASIGGDGCALIDRNDSSIWFEENEELHQTDLSLIEFIETMCKEVSEL